jgi:hypothetical protein
LEKRLEEQRKIDEQKEKDKKKVYGQHYQDKEGLDVPEIAATDDSIAHGWREVSSSAPTPNIIFLPRVASFGSSDPFILDARPGTRDNWTWPWTPSSAYACKLQYGGQGAFNVRGYLKRLRLTSTSGLCCYWCSARAGQLIRPHFCRVVRPTEMCQFRQTIKLLIAM